MDKIIISAALTGNLTMPTQTPYLPITPEEIAEEARRAAEAGAAIVHVHARDPQNGRPTSDPQVYMEIARKIKERTDAIICITTGGTMYMTPEERLRSIPVLKPELATFNMGSINFSIHPLAERYKDEDWKFPWEKEFVESTKDFIFRNTFGDMEKYCETFYANGVVPECEIYDVGHLYNMSFLIRRGLLKKPIWMQFVTGVLGGIGADPENVIFLKNKADKLIGPENYRWSVIGVGYPAEFQLAALAIVMGGNVRVGFEDNIFIDRGVLARSNAELVEKVVRLAREFGREPASPDEARQILGLKGKDKVNF